MTAIVIHLVIHIIQNDARLWKVTKELRQLRKDLANKS